MDFDNITNFKQIAADTDTSVEMIIPDLTIDRGQCRLLIADAGTGKTYFTLDVMLKASRGEAIFDKTPKRKLRTCLLDYETGEVSLNRRLERLSMGNELPDNLFIVQMTTKLDSSDKVLEDLEKAILENKWDIIFIDSLLRAIATDPNSQAASRVVTNLRSLAKRTKCSIVILHHTGKDGVKGDKSGSGTKTFVDSVEVMQTFKKRKDGVFCRLQKSNDFTPTDFVFNLVDIGPKMKKWANEFSQNIKLEYQKVDRHRSEEEKEYSVKDEILDLLKNNEMSRTQIKKSLKGTDSVKIKVINDMIKSGDIEKIGTNLKIKDGE